MPDFAAGCTTDGATAAPPLVIPGGKEPDWGPADVPAARPAAGGGTARGRRQPNARSRCPSRSLSATRRGGVKLTRQGRRQGQAQRHRQGRPKKLAGKASKTVKKAGTASLKLQVTRKGKVTLKVTFKPTSGASRPPPSSLNPT